MATFTNLDTIQRPSSGLVAPASWGDAVNDNCNVLNTVLQWANGAVANWSSGVQLICDTVEFTAASAGTTIDFPVSCFSSWAIVVATLVTTGSATSLSVGTTTSAHFIVKVWDGTTQVTSGSFNLNYIAFGN